MVLLYNIFRLGNNSVQDILPFVYRWSLESITAIFLNKKLGCLENNLSEDAKILIESANTVLGPDMFKLVTYPPIWKYINVPYFRFESRIHYINYINYYYLLH